MARISTKAVLLIAAVLALLLIAYVFTGSRPARGSAAPHCASPQALDQVKAELFRRAARVRGNSDPEFVNLARYSVVRAPSRMVRRHHGNSGKVTCTGAIALDRPPGVAMAGGQRSIGSSLSYDLEPAAGGVPHLLALGKSDAFVVPLATAFQNAGQAGQPVPTADPAQTPGPAEVNVVDRPVSAAPVPPRVPTAAPPPPPAPRREPAKSSPPPATSDADENPKPSPASSPPPAKRPAPAVAKAPAPAAITAGARPSFNCRYARTRGEKAVCANAGLASLDRQMAGQFYRALSAARPGQRAMLEKSRKRFLRFRDSCATQTCIADAYRGRMREISDIVDGGY
jgi:uncharacterized protein YecT (DUF1311 family)